MEHFPIAERERMLAWHGVNGSPRLGQLAEGHMHPRSSGGGAP